MPVAVCFILVGVGLLTMGAFAREIARSVRSGRNTLRTTEDVVDGTSYPDVSDFELAALRRTQMIATHYHQVLLLGALSLAVAAISIAA